MGPQNVKEACGHDRRDCPTRWHVDLELPMRPPSVRCVCAEMKDGSSCEPWHCDCTWNSL
eukprot:642611-Pyramimonas_sp.AAC.1